MKLKSFFDRKLTANYESVKSFPEYEGIAIKNENKNN